MTDKEAIKFGIETLEYMRDNFPYMDDERKQALNFAIKALEEQPIDEWIPVSERLPEENTAVLITTDKGKVDKIRWNLWWQKQTVYPNHIRAIAWQPLPEPYVKGGEVNETGI